MRVQPSAISATPATQNGSRCVQVPPLPRETKVDVSKCHACHTKCSYCPAMCSYMSPSATHHVYHAKLPREAAATTAAAENRAHHQSQPSAIRATPATQSDDPCHHLSATPATQKAAATMAAAENRARHQSQPSAIYVPRLPRETKVDVSKSHACQAKCSYMSPSATPATQKAAATTAAAENRARHQSPAAQCHRCHACHVKRRWMSQRATPARQSAATCRQVPRLPRKKPRRPRRPLRTERATRASPVPYTCRLPGETKGDVSKCHACHAKCSYMSPSARPATQKVAAAAENRARHQSQPSAIRATPAT